MSLKKHLILSKELGYTKSAATRTLIKSTFISLLEEKPLTNISVKDIVKAADLNRNTFYYHFKNIPDLIESIVKDSVDELLRVHPPTFDSYEDCLLIAINFAEQNKRSIYHIYNSESRIIFERHLWKICDYSIEKYIASFPTHAPFISENELEIFTEMLKYECFGFVMNWIMRGMPEGVQSKIKLLAASIKNQMRFAAIK